MLKRASMLKENDGYIIDSLGWAYYANQNYVVAEKFLKGEDKLQHLQMAVS